MSIFVPTKAIFSAAHFFTEEDASSLECKNLKRITIKGDRIRTQ